MREKYCTAVMMPRRARVNEVAAECLLMLGAIVYGVPRHEAAGSEALSNQVKEDVTRAAQFEVSAKASYAAVR